MDLKTVRDQFNQVAEKQELSTTRYEQLIDKVTNEINQAITDLKSADHISDDDHESVIEHLKDKLDAYSLQEQFKMLKNDVNDDLSNYSQILDEFVEPDILKAYRNVEFDSDIVNQTILPLLYREGLFDVADTFLNESQEPDNILLRSQFTEMHQILDELEARNLEPAVSWMLANRQKLDQRRSTLEFDLRRLQFLDILQRNQLEALNFAKTHISPLASDNWIKFLNLMGCLLWPGAKLQTSPYKDLLNWVAVGQELMLEFCDWIGVSFKNPLAVTVAAGALALPTYVKFAHTAVSEEEYWVAMRENPVAVELGREFQFHSVFVCPVIKEQLVEYKWPGMLPCGHVFSIQAIWNLSFGCTHTFKCPTCRRPNVSVAQCRTLYL